ncbi:MAG TPA: hypothetical protein ACFYD6_03640 [Candidatus Brocadiia bacterium]|nr:hypothetical protein [Candidatus Brocadiales bacterium]
MKLLLGFISLAALTLISFVLIVSGFIRLFNAAREGLAITPGHLFICFASFILGSLILGFVFAQSAKD